MTLIAKSIAAALTGLTTWGVTAQANGIDGAEWWGLATVLVGAFLVWLTPNESGNVNIADRLRGDAGRVNWSTVALVLLAIVAVLWALDQVPR